MDWHKVLDETAEALDQRGDETLAVVCDALVEHLDEPEIAAVLDDVADALDQRGEEALAYAFDRISDQQSSTADAVLRDSAASLFERLRRYGASRYDVRGDTVEFAVDRGTAVTTASVAFASRDEEGRPRLRVAFRCGDDQMIRWATMPTVTSRHLGDAVDHVFATGQNYGSDE